MVLKGAFIGFGNVAEGGHAAGWRDRDDLRIVAAADSTLARADRLKAVFPDARFFSDPAAMLAAEQLDFVDVCTPPGSHAALIAQALEAGLHVLCEKPTVTRLADLEPLAASSRKRGLVLHTVHNWLMAPICRKITELVDGAAVGRVRSVQWETLRTQPAVAVPSGAKDNWRTDPAQAGGGILFDHGWHAFYCVARWAGGGPRTVAATLEQRKFTEWALEDTASVDIDFGEATASVFLTWTADERANRIVIEGERGTISVVADAVILDGPEGRQAWSCPPALSEGSHHPDRFSGVCSDFLDAIGQGGEGNIGEALMCARLIDRAQASDAAGSRVSYDAEVRPVK